MSSNNFENDDLESILREFSEQKAETRPSAPERIPENEKIIPEESPENAQTFTRNAPPEEQKSTLSESRPSPREEKAAPTVRETEKYREEEYEQLDFSSIDTINDGIGADPGPAIPAIDPDAPESNFYEDGSYGNSDYYDEDAEEERDRFGLFKKKNRSQDIDEEDDYDYGEDKPRKKWILPVVIISVLLIAAACGIYYAATLIDSGDKIFPNVYVDITDVGGMTADEARSMLEICNWEKTVSGDLEIRLPMDVTEDVNYVEAGVRMTIDEAVEAAVAYGRDDDIFAQLINYVNAMIIPSDVTEREIVIDSEYVMSKVEEAAEKFDKATADNAYSVDIDKAIFTMLQGAGEVRIDTAELYTKVETALLNEEESVIYRSADAELTPPDFEKILEEVKAEPSDAYYDTEKNEIVEEVVGVEFDPAEALKIWKEAQTLDTIEVPMFTTPAKVTAKELKETLFVDILGEYSTSYSGSTDNRISNIKLAVNTINGTVLNPGDTFSYNETLGERTAEKGYLEAAAYDNGDVVQALGGGICQVSSTLCCAVRLAMLDYTRTCHQFQVAYIDAGLDATVDYTNFENGGGVDFTFTNNKDYPIRVECSVDEEEETVTFRIYGTDVDHYTVNLEKEFVGYLSHSDAFGYDETHSDTWNSTRVGYMYDAYAEVYDADGNFVKKIYTYDYDRCWYYYHKEDRNYPDEEPITADEAVDEDTSAEEE